MQVMQIPGLWVACNLMENFLILIIKKYLPLEYWFHSLHITGTPLETNR